MFRSGPHSGPPRYRRPMRLLPVIALLVVAGAARPAEAMKCRTSIGEDFALRLVGVYDGARKIGAPPELRRIDELGSGALMVFIGQREHDARAYRMDRPLPAGWGVITHFREVLARRWVHTACGTSIPLTPLLPGRYVFDKDWDEEPVAAEVAASVVIVAPGRDRVELRTRVGGRPVRAVYQVVCATFATRVGDPPPCAASQSLPLAEDLATAMARPPLDEDAEYWEVLDWMIGAEEEEVEDGEDVDENGELVAPPAVESQWTGVLAEAPISSGRRSAEAAAVVAKTAAIAPPPAAVDPPASAARCGVMEPGSPGWLMLVGLAVWRRRSPR